MPGSSSTSFIPKHTPNKPERRSSPRQVFFGTLLVRILFVATLVAALGVFLYLRKLDNQLAVEVTNFNAAASAYDAGAKNLDAIVAMDKRLLMAKNIYEKSVSINALFTAIERSVIGTVQLDSVDIRKEDSGELNLVASVKTDSFDSTMFQRSVLKDSEVLGKAIIEDVSVVTEKSNLESAEDSTEEGSLTFRATMMIDPASIKALVVSDGTFIPVPDVVSPETPVQEATTPSESVSDDTSNSATVDEGLDS